MVDIGEYEYNKYPDIDPNARDCGSVEYHLRKAYSSIFYYRIYRKLFPNNPFYTPKAIKRIESLINKDSRVFEWGSGVSTIWWAEHVNELISVEHDKEWYDKGIKSFEERKIDNAILVFSPPIEDMNNFSWKNEWRYYEVLKKPPGKPQFKDYMSAIDKYPDSHFDCIAIDGRERVGCLLHAVPKLSKKGFIVLDDSYRYKYKQCFNILSDWHIEKFDCGLMQTTLFLRNESQGHRLLRL
jgi:hypothetical protein